jgi:2'-5' RNA ligase
VSHGPARARLFVAVELPPPVRTELSGWARQAAGVVRAAGGELRLLEPEKLHLTLCFLGERPVAEIPRIEGAIASLTPPEMGEVSLGAPLWLPPRRPRSLAVEVHDDQQGALEMLHHQLQLALNSAVRDWRAERRRFLAHVTVARMRAGGARAGLNLAATPSLAFTPAVLVLYRSWLSRAGSSYESLLDLALGMAERPGEVGGDG